MGPQVKVDGLIFKIETVYKMVVSFHGRIQSFYKISQDQNEKIPAYTIRIEGA